MVYFNFTVPTTSHLIWLWKKLIASVFMAIVNKWIVNKQLKILKLVLLEYS